MKIQTIKEALKSKGITTTTKYHNYNYLYNTFLEIAKEYSKSKLNCLYQSEIRNKILNNF